MAQRRHAHLHGIGITTLVLGHNAGLTYLIQGLMATFLALGSGLMALIGFASKRHRARTWTGPVAMPTSP